MKFHELKLSPKKPRRRAGRGISAGLGKTAGRGTKGQKARKGNGRKPGFEGGQNPLMQRLPKLQGFTSHKAASENVYTDQLNGLGVKVDNFTLADAGLISSPYAKVKLVSRGELNKKVTVSLQSASESAKQSIQKKGGSFKQVARVKRTAKSTDKNQ